MAAIWLIFSKKEEYLQMNQFLHLKIWCLWNYKKFSKS